MQLLASPISMVLHATNNQPLAMWLQLFGVGLRVGAVILASIFLPSLLTEIYAFTGFLFYFVYLLVVLKVAGVSGADFFGRNRIVLLAVMVIYIAQLMMMLIGPMV